ncbi:4370_t:CDS:1, partial [Funneliformis caledonium]
MACLTDEGHKDKYDNDYLIGSNSKTVSIMLSRLLGEYPSSHYLKERALTAQISTITFQMNSTSEKELLKKFE